MASQSELAAGAASSSTCRSDSEVSELSGSELPEAESESSSSTATATSLTDKLRAPRPSDLARKRNHANSC